MEQCVFCDQANNPDSVLGGPLYDDELVYASHVDTGEGITYLGHLILQTKRHTPDFAGLTRYEAERLGLLVMRLSGALKACTGAEKVYVVFFGEVVPHLHAHLTSRYPGAPREYWRMNVEDWPEAPRGDSHKVIDLCANLRASLATP